MLDQLKLGKKRRDLIHAYRHTFGSELGKMVLHDLMRVGHMLHPTFIQGDQHATAFREGERNIVLLIHKYLGTDPETLSKQIEEIERMKNE